MEDFLSFPFLFVLPESLSAQWRHRVTRTGKSEVDFGTYFQFILMREQFRCSSFYSVAFVCLSFQQRIKSSAERTSTWISGGFTGHSERCQWVVRRSADAIYLCATMRAITKATQLLISLCFRHDIFMTHCFRVYWLLLSAFTQEWPFFPPPGFSRSAFFNDCTL